VIHIVYLGPVAPHWRVDSYGESGEIRESDEIEDFRQRVLARLLLLPPHDPQFARNQARIDRDAEEHGFKLAWVEG
jgi:hypothetical protein